MIVQRPESPIGKVGRSVAVVVVDVGGLASEKFWLCLSSLTPKEKGLGASGAKFSRTSAWKIDLSRFSKTGQKVGQMAKIANNNPLNYNGL
ncbi:hypothetical protein GCM10007071_31180 [Marinobacter zhanjiangensis]|uniref:Uncharacterized protein n=1 Tax=Marinobacter zhanjiangensis TaxID=578215 RepID=A0ABQ3B634_9GAMM|nr:hypothetical protein GCM10007071_31180 [Marinobacter zhanjiangensis]